MQDNRMKLRVSVHLITLIVLVVMACVFAACNRNPANQNGETPRTLTTPSPSPAPSGSPAPELIPGDTIIVVKDGSVKIKVNKDKLCSDDDDPQHPENPDKKFKCDYELGPVGIQTTSGPTCLPAPTDKVLINGGTDEEIEVKQSGGKTSIKFKKAKYFRCPFTPDGEYCGLNHVNTIEVGSTKISCVPDDKCEVFVKKK